MTSLGCANHVYNVSELNGEVGHLSTSNPFMEEVMVAKHQNVKHFVYF